MSEGIEASTAPFSAILCCSSLLRAQVQEERIYTHFLMGRQSIQIIFKMPYKIKFPIHSHKMNHGCIF